MNNLLCMLEAGCWILGCSVEHQEQQSIRARCFHPAGTFIEFREDKIEGSIPDIFEEQVAKDPQRLAVKSGSHKLTYDELNRFANRVARAILKLRGEGEEPIAFMLEHGALPIVTVLGILKTGKIYMPLEPSYPRDRNAYVLENSQAGLIVTNNRNLSLASELVQNESQLLNIDNLDPGISAENLGLSISPDTVAWILYTSGSTGQPKGAFNNHRNTLYDAGIRINTYHICADDRLSFLPSCAFSRSLRQVFPALLSGASLHTLNIGEVGVSDLIDWMLQEKITVHHYGTRTIFREFLNILTGKERFPDLRLFAFGGDALYKKDVELLRKRVRPDIIATIGLGTTEAGTVTQYLMDENTQIMGNISPIGYAIDDREVLLLDDDGQEVGFNQVGEIAIKSRYISLGYWRRPDLTEARFLPDPNGGDERIYLTGDMGLMRPGGCLMHMGRKDFQVKIRNHRVEVAEVEIALSDHDDVEDVVVIAREDLPIDKCLVAYLVVNSVDVPRVSELRRFLKEKLPGYMVPSAFVIMSDSPLTVTGKVDRLALPAPSTARPELENPFVAPRTPVEETLAELWSKVLGFDEVGICDSFFDLGGHSLMATQIISRVIDTFQVKLPLSSLFQSPTVADMAEVIVQNLAEKAQQREIGYI
ncbi:AMP-binding protein [Candidatus Poribacteria bacterium]